MGDGPGQEGKYDTAANRWAGVGPYYAMFPVTFADRVIESYTSAGETVLDPFAGRATSIYSAATNGRYGLGCELNPVGWVYAQAKLQLRVQVAPPPATLSQTRSTVGTAVSCQSSRTSRT